MYRGNVLLVLLEKMLFFYHIFRIKFIWYKNNEKTKFSTEKWHPILYHIFFIQKCMYFYYQNFFGLKCMYFYYQNFFGLKCMYFYKTKTFRSKMYVFLLNNLWVKFNLAALDPYFAQTEALFIPVPQTRQ